MNGMGFGPHKHLLLDQFGQLVFAAWGDVGYQVGSSLTSSTWRDVDIRVMLSDEEYERRLGPVWQTGMRHKDLGYRAEMLAWSTLGERMTGLPIDFQVERESEANALFPTEGRNPIGVAFGLTRHARVAVREREEIERFRSALRFLLTSTHCRNALDCHAAGMLDMGAHDELCAVRIAWDALNPRGGE